MPKSSVISRRSPTWFSTISRVCTALFAFQLLATVAAFGQTPLVPCSDPAGCPDLTVDRSRLAADVNTQTLDFASDDCAVVEGMISGPGRHKLLRFSTEYPNWGPGDLIIGKPADHPDWFEWSPCHGHYHFKEYSDYRLWTPAGYQAWSTLRQSTPPDVLSRDLLAQHPEIAQELVQGDKRAFCVIDVDQISPNAGPKKYTDCLSDQGISVGWADIYFQQLAGQWIDITNQPSGNYVLEIEVNAEHLFEEANYANNSTSVSVVIPWTIWNDSFTPVNASARDGQQIETGVRFRSDTAGFITGIRFYKGATNGGTHTAHLWTNGGTLLRTAPFSAETASGWQEAYFSSPVPVSANTTYVGSYYSFLGGYSVDRSYFASEFASPPLRALADGSDGPNGVYRYGSSGFPTSTYQKSNYWVDVLFSTSAGPPDSKSPTVASVAPTSGARSVNVQTNVTAKFSEDMNPATITTGTFEVRDGSGALVSGTVNYDPLSLTATFDPASSLAFSTVYTAKVKGGSTGVKDVAGLALASDFTWSFTTSAPPPPPPDQGPGGPILVVTGSSAFSSYYAEILRAEGLNAFLTRDLSSVTSTTLAPFDVVILGNIALTAAQVTMFSDWVAAGGNLIAMRPDKGLAGLLGLTDAGGTLSNGYLKIDTSAPPGAGIVGSTIQFHGTADTYTLNGASAVATLYSSASTPTPNPAVTLRAVGSSGGQAAAFTFDLARSIVYTRQGNPAWVGQERDGQARPIGSDDLFYGAKVGDVQPDWVDLSRVEIPQADEQQRLLANLIGLMNLDRKPLPRFWYFPKGKKAVVIMTGDDHAVGGTAGRFDAYKATSPVGCSVTDWECVRSTSYIYTATPLSDSQAAAYDAQGFEIGLHVTTYCGNVSDVLLDAFVTDQLAEFGSKYTSLPQQVSNRIHCAAWNGWANTAKIELAHGIRLDTNYYFWPPSWVGDRPGMFTGSGLPMRFADLDGTMIDVYQATTQMTDESGQTYPKTIDILLDNAIGPTGYYGAFTANMHTDLVSSAGSDAIVASAQSRGVPIVSSRQMLSWLDGRNGSAFSGISWTGSKLAFSISVGSGATNLQAMVPTQSAVGLLTGITRGGSGITFTKQTIKGVEYAFFPATQGAYEAQYGSDSTAPVISSVVATPGSGGTATVTWITDDPSSSRVDYGTSASSLSLNVSDPTLVTSHVVPLSGLATGTTYYYRVTSVNAALLSSTSPSPPSPPATFTPAAATLADTTATDFGLGTVTGTAVSRIVDGEVILGAAINEEFGGTTLPSGWSATPWRTGGGGATVGGGVLTVDGARAITDASFGPGRALEFVATFGATSYEHVGFVADSNFNPPWALFGTSNTTNTFYARTNVAGTLTDVVIPGSWLGSPHRYRIEWTASAVAFFIDGNLVQTTNVAIAANMRPAVTEFAIGSPSVVVDWLRMTPYSPSGSFESRVFDAGQTVTWGNLSWGATVPTGTSLGLFVRTGGTPTPDGTWSPFTAISSSGGPVSATSRYLQYRADLATTDPLKTPVLLDVTVTLPSTGATPSITSFSPTSGGVGTSVVITGTNLTGATAVKFNGTSATFTVNSSTQITATVPSGATTGPIAVTTSGGTATSSGAFTVVAAPTIAGFSPTSGSVGTSVVITGTNLTGATAVRFNGTNATFTVNSATQITATVPSGATTGPLAVTTPAGTATSGTSFTVIAAPTITSFSPTSGSAGTSVVITGTNLTGATAVRFNGVVATTYTVNSATQITATVPSGATTGPISVTTPGGTATSASAFTVGSTPTVSSFSPSAGAVGDVVSIIGANFNGVTNVTFGGIGAAPFTANSSTQITATVPLGAPTGRIGVTTSGGSGISAVDFAVTPFSPVLGPAGTAVTIKGSNFTGATSVTFNGVSASFTVDSATQVTATVPSGATTGPIVVTAPGGTLTTSTPFTVTPFSPVIGPVGTTVIITGSNFTGATSVTFNGVAATFTVNSSTQITATVPPGATTGLIVVTAPGGTLTTVTPFTVTPFSPVLGPEGTTVTVTGSNFTGATGVTFNGVNAVFIVNSDTRVTATVPAGATTGPITVITPSGGAPTASHFQVTSPAITGFSPTAGATGTSVRITGANFQAATAVRFNGTTTTFSIDAPMQITAIVPSGATTGPIGVSTPTGTATSSSNFTVTSPSITSFSPTSGGVGTSVVITGTNLSGATAVRFNGTNATFTVNSATQITATVPSGATTGPIAVTTPTGTATSSGSFTVIAPPSITSFSPTSGGVGTSVVITGTNLSGATAVRFNGVSATAFTVNSSTQITAAVPSGATSGPIAVTTPGGTATSAGSFTVIPAPTITGISPMTGPVGTTVVITGTNLNGATSVKFNGVGATYTINSSTQITTTVPAKAKNGPISVTTPGGTATSPTPFKVK